MHENNMRLKTNFRPVLFLVFGFLAGCLLTGLLFCRQRSASPGGLDTRYDIEYTRAAEIIGRLEEELGRERDFNNQLREHNNRARELTEELAGTSERNVRNLQDAIAIIGEIRRKLQVLADFYSDSNPGFSSY